MIRVFEAFAGIGTQRMALRNLGIPHEVVAISEIDKFAIKSYEAIHGETLNLGDISKIDVNDVPEHDLFTFSFPCVDVSVAGKQAGLEKGSGTRSSLLWECERIIKAKRPKYLLMENVKNLVGKKHKEHFEMWLETLVEYGYTNYYKVLNAKDYGIPQNRERVFCVSILGEHEPYVFQKPIKLEKRLKDVLEDEVDEKFYLSQEQLDKITFSTYKDPKCVKVKILDDTYANRDARVYEDYSPCLRSERSGLEVAHAVENNTSGLINLGEIPKEVLNDNSKQRRLYSSDGTSPSILARTDSHKIVETNNVMQIAQYDTPTRKNSNRFRVYDKDGISPTINTMQGGGRQPSVLIKNGTKKGYLEATDGDGIDLSYPDSKTRRGRVQKQSIQTLDTADNKGVVIAASRGRNPENPSDRTVGSQTEQRLEINKQGASNTITTVQKDNYVVEPKIKKIGNIYPSGGQAGKVYDPNGISVTVTGQRVNSQGYLLTSDGEETTNFRIRKLTPKECWRLMGISDEDFEKAEKVNSNSQLYKQAGNAIVVDVLERIFENLFIQGR